MQRRKFLALGFLPWWMGREVRADDASSLLPRPTGVKPPFELAELWQEGQSLDGWWVSEKYDGVRVYWDGYALLTRNGYRVPVPVEWTAGWPREPLDGELWAGRGQFQRVQALVARQPGYDETAEAQSSAWSTVRFMVFDMPAHSGNFDARMSAAQALLGRLPPQAKHMQWVSQRRVLDEAQLQALLHEVVRGGGEGLMLRRAAAHYRAGRSPHLRKLKMYEDAEARVIAHIPGRGRHAGRLGALLVEAPDGRRFRIGTGLKDAQRDRPPPIGSWVTYRYRGLHAGSGLPRFASFLRAHDEGFVIP